MTQFPELTRQQLEDLLATRNGQVAELVAALEAIVGAAWEEEYGSGYVICASAMKEASAALAKAEQVRS